MDYSLITTALVNQTRGREDALPIRNDGCRSRFFLKLQPTRRVCLFFHGFTAAPYQFVPMAETLFRSGYNVLIPLLPGHGQAGNWSLTNLPPLPTEAKVYQEFALKWLQIAQELGEEVIVGGLSGGGTLAGWLALERPQQIARTLLFAPYLSGSNRVVDMFTRLANMGFEWKLKPGEVAIGYTHFSVAALRVFLSLGQEILHQAQHKRAIAPLFVISSESDIAVDHYDHRTLFEAALKQQPNCWYHLFSHVLDIPHTMMTQAEGNRYQNLLITMSKAFIESNLTWADVEEIGYRMTQGKTFNTVVEELHLTSKVSRDMPAMMTMVDKRSIVEDRNPQRPRRI